MFLTLENSIWLLIFWKELYVLYGLTLDIFKKDNLTPETQGSNGSPVVYVSSTFHPKSRLIIKWCLTSMSRIFHLYWDVTIFRWSGRNFDLCSALRAMCRRVLHRATPTATQDLGFKVLSDGPKCGQERIQCRRPGANPGLWDKNISVLPLL